MLLFGKDWRYKRLLRQAMRRIERDDIENLVIDIRLNGGGMLENVYYTLDYLTDKPADIISTYMINDASREKVQTVISNSTHMAEADREYLIKYIDSVPSGTRFRTDTVKQMQYIPQKPKHNYDGNVYILTSNATYSAAQIFARYCQALSIGPVAGQHCGGYNAVTGNTVTIKLPASPWMEFQVPYMENIVSVDDEPYAYPNVDIPIEHSFEEWLKRENNSLDRLLEIIEETE
jgi:C-terminal processing protease CtpA/Prc